VRGEPITIKSFVIDMIIDIIIIVIITIIWIGLKFFNQLVSSIEITSKVNNNTLGY